MAREACPGIPEPLCRMKRDAKHKPQVGGGWHPPFPDGCVRNSVTVSSARQLPVRAALRQNANACAFTLHRFLYSLYYTRTCKKSQSAFCISFFPLPHALLWIFLQRGIRSVWNFIKRAAIAHLWRATAALFIKFESLMGQSLNPDRRICNLPPFLPAVSEFFHKNP